MYDILSLTAVRLSQHFWSGALTWELIKYMNLVIEEMHLPMTSNHPKQKLTISQEIPTKGLSQAPAAVLGPKC